jgi:hypothetical protein
MYIQIPYDRCYAYCVVHFCLCNFPYVGLCFQDTVRVYLSGHFNNNIWRFLQNFALFGQTVTEVTIFRNPATNQKLSFCSSMFLWEVELMYIQIPYDRCYAYCVVHFCLCNFPYVGLCFQDTVRVYLSGHFNNNI